MWQGVGVTRGGLREVGYARWVSREVDHVRWVSCEVGLMQGGVSCEAGYTRWVMRGELCKVSYAR